MAKINGTFLEDPRLNAPEDFARSLIDHIEDLASRRAAAMGGLGSSFTKANVEALERLAYFLHEVDGVRDRRIATLAFINAAFSDLRRVERKGGEREGDEIGTRADRFEEATPFESGVLQRLAEYGDAPSADQTLSDLAVAGVCDLAARCSRLVDRERRGVHAIEQQLNAANAELASNRVDAAALQQAKAEAEIAQAEVAERDKIIADLREMVATFAPKRPRRTQIEPSIYRAASGSLEVAEAVGKGKTKWHVLDGGSLAEARLLREELRGDTADPEPRDEEAELDAIEARIGRPLTEEETAGILDDDGEDVVDRWVAKLAKSTPDDRSGTEEVTV